MVKRFNILKSLQHRRRIMDTLGLFSSVKGMIHSLIRFYIWPTWAFLVRGDDMVKPEERHLLTDEVHFHKVYYTSGSHYAMLPLLTELPVGHASSSSPPVSVTELQQISFPFWTLLLTLWCELCSCNNVIAL